MARPLWKGTLGFGLVSIPIEVHTAVRDVGPHFHFLRQSNLSRIHYRKVAANDDQPVAPDELVRGFDLMKRLRASLGQAAGPTRMKGKAAAERTGRARKGGRRRAA